MTDTNDDLPEGWAESTFGDLAEVIGGGTPSAKDPKNFCEKGGYPWLTPADLSKFKGMYVSHGARNLTRSGLDNSSAKLMPKGTVLMSSRAPIGYVAVASNEISTNQGFKSFVCSPGVKPEYVFFWIKSINNQLQEMGSGSTFAEISGTRAKEIPIRIAPIAEQDRIVAKVETVLAEVDASREHLSGIPAILKRFRQSVLASACSGRLTAKWRDDADEGELKVPEPSNPRAIVEVEEIFDAPKGWRWLPLVALCQPNRAICYGVIKLGEEHPDGIPCLRTSDVKPLRIDTNNVKRIAPEISSEYRRTLLRGGEVLVNVRGTLGGVAVVPSELRDWNISREVALVPIAGVLPKFVAFWIASLPCQNWLTELTKGVAYTGINIEDLRLLPIGLPSLSEQREIVCRVAELFALADQIEASYAKAAACSEKLTESILAKAFRGELVPTEAELARQEGRDYEPASVLLERIRAIQRKS